jgi:hypothetical protein
MTVLFFMWGFMTVFNDILIPRFKDAFTLDYFHAMLVQFAFFGAYFIGSLLYFAISASFGDPIARLAFLASRDFSFLPGFLNRPFCRGARVRDAPDCR